MASHNILVPSLSILPRPAACRFHDTPCVHRPRLDSTRCLRWSGILRICRLISCITREGRARNLNLHRTALFHDALLQATKLVTSPSATLNKEWSKTTIVWRPIYCLIFFYFFSIVIFLIFREDFTFNSNGKLSRVRALLAYTSVFVFFLASLSINYL